MNSGSGPRGRKQRQAPRYRGKPDDTLPLTRAVSLKNSLCPLLLNILSSTHILRMIRKHLSPLVPRLRQRVGLFKWLIPLGLMFLVALYELGPGQWIYAQGGINSRTVTDVLIFGTVGPVLAFFALSLLEQWFEERETSDLQAEIRAHARRDAERSRQLSDDAIQVLFAAAAFLGSLQYVQAKIPTEYVTELRNTEAALDAAIKKLRIHLLND